MRRNPSIQCPSPALPLSKGPRFQTKAFISLVIFIQFWCVWRGMPPFPCCYPSCPSQPQDSLRLMSWCPEAWSGGKAGHLVALWGCWSPLLGRMFGKGTDCQHSELHYVPSRGCTIVGGRGVPQPQKPNGLRDQVSRVSPEKQLRTRAPGRGNDRAEG